MIKVGIFMADGCEEIEGLTVVDIVRRAKLEIETISITEKAEVTSSHQSHLRQIPQRHRLILTATMQSYCREHAGYIKPRGG